MEKIKVHDRTFRLLIPYSEIAAATQTVADKLNRDYSDCKEPPILMCILNGAIPFTAELMKDLTFDHELVCMKVSSYQGTETTGHVKIMVKPTADVKGRRIIICEDIVDTGTTIRFLRKDLMELGAEDVTVCCMMYKPEKLRGRLIKEGLIPQDASEEQVEKFAPEYRAMIMPNDFLVGFGLDYNELGRQYRDIYILDE